MQSGINTTAPRLLVSCCDKKHVFDLMEVIRLEAKSSYTVIHSLHRRPLTVARVLSKYAQLLQAAGFVRTHRSHLINKQFIRGIDVYGNLVLWDDSKLTVPRRKKKKVHQQIQKH